VEDRRRIDKHGRKIYVLHDLYPHADLVMYPSIYEGFGNALLEAFYYMVPVVVNRYPVWVRDIEPKGFMVPMMDGFINNQVVGEVRRVLDDEEYRQEMVVHNYNLASRYYGYPILRYGLRTLLNNIKNQM